MPHRRPILALACLLIACPLFGAGNRMMRNPPTFTAGVPYPNAGVRVGDFNGDGKQDVLVIGSSSVASYLGNGDGTFAAGVASGSSASTYEGQNVADFNGDGRADLLVSKYKNAGFGILFGQGDGTFGAPVSITTSNAVVGAVAGDFDGDGKADVLTHEKPASNQNVFVIYAGSGNGAFASGVPSTVVASSDEYRTLRAGDFDGDGKLDVAGALSSNATQLFFNNGDRTFGAAAFRLDGQVRTVADFNSDGVSDLVTVDGTSSDGLTRAFLGRADRGAWTALDLRCNGVSDAVVANLDADGLPEVLGIGGGATLGVVSPGAGGFFRAPRLYGVKSISAIASADFNGDGKADVVTLDVDAFSVALGSGDGTLPLPRAFDLGLAFSSAFPDMAFLDVDGDARPDIVTSEKAADLSLVTLFALPAGGYGPAVRTVIPRPSPSLSLEAFVAGDVTGDGRPDMLVQNQPSSGAFSIQVMEGTASGTFTPGFSWQTSESIRAIVDANGDGRIDVLADKLYFGDGFQAFIADSAAPVGLVGIPYFVDLNGDGRIDRLNSQNAWLAKADGTFAAPVPLSGVEIEAVGDFNGDGFPDIVNKTDVYPGRGDGTFGKAVVSIYGAGVAQDLVAAAMVESQGPTSRSSVRALDFDGDGKLDLMRGAAIFYGDGTGHFETAAGLLPESGGALPLPDTLFPADVEHDGKRELVWRSMPDRVVVLPLTQPVGGLPTTISAAWTNSTPYPPAYGGAASILATVAGPGARKPTGAVRFRAGARDLGLQPIRRDGTAMIYAQLNAGTTTITAEYVGDDQLAPATATCDVTVTQRSTRTTAKVDNTSPRYRAPVVFSSTTVGDLFDYTPTPATGNVTFKLGTTVLGTVAAGQSLTVQNGSLFTVGDHFVTAEYEGDTNYLASTSSPLKVTVQRATPQATLQPPPGPVLVHQPVPITLTFANGTGATGTVTFYVNDASIGTVTVANDAASITYNFPSSGTFFLRADSSGDQSYEARSFTATPVTVYATDLSTRPQIHVQEYVHSGSNFVPLIQWRPVAGATRYDFYRAVNGQPLTLWRANQTLNGGSDTVPPGEARLYAVVAHDDDGHYSPMSKPAIFVSMDFTDDPLVAGGTWIKAQHVNELQIAVNLVRGVIGRPQASFTPVAAGSLIFASTMQQLHDSLADARTYLGLATTYDIPVIAPGAVVRAVHVQELRNAMRSYEYTN